MYRGGNAYRNKLELLKRRAELLPELLEGRCLPALRVNLHSVHPALLQQSRDGVWWANVIPGLC